MIPPPVFVIAGPTATGKTEIAIRAAKALGAELVGADSMQVYRKMDIGTDTPSAAQLDGVVHRMIDLVDPDHPYDAAAYSRDADAAIAATAAAGRRVVLVGGTGLYIRILLRGLQAGPSPDPQVRDRIAASAERLGWPAMHRTLGELDPEAAARLHPNDGVRILRALEVFEQSGVTITEWQREHAFASPRYRYRMVALELPASRLEARIDARVDGMMARGFLEEVSRLLDEGYPPALKPMQGLGYRRLCDHLAGRTSLEAAVAAVKTDTRRLAKRQRTWFRGERDAEWVPPDAEEVTSMAMRFFETAEGAP
jgi:tRNA dimethylallyltransferase